MTVAPAQTVNGTAQAAPRAIVIALTRVFGHLTAHMNDRVG
jgi:hypothetical protein